MTQNWKKELVKHTSMWALITIYLSYSDPVIGTWSTIIIGTLMYLSIYIFTYYSLILIVFKKFWCDYLYMMVGILFSCIIFESLIIFYAKTALPYIGGQNVHYPIEILLPNTLLLYLFIFICSLGNHLNRLGNQKIRLHSEREKDLIVKELEFLKREKAILNKELDFLKNQFNAHITFNFLAFCHSNLYKTSKIAAEATETFADMLRYSLQIKPDEKVVLKKEIEYIENFIGIQRCITTVVCSNFKYEGCIESQLILPRILITFVENAFKHGQIDNELHPIELYLDVSPNRIFFKIKNEKIMNKKIHSTNTGHKNVKQMLDLFYKEEYSLNIEETISSYLCELTIFT